MEKLKKPKMQHDHSWTDILKVGIFAILMLAPFFAIASKCLYVTCNKNAKDSYSGINQNENKLLEIINESQFIEGIKYTAYESGNQVNTQSNYIGFTWVSEDLSTYTNYDPNIDYKYFNVSTNQYVYFFDENLTNRIYKNVWKNNYQINFVFNDYVDNSRTFDEGNIKILFVSLQNKTLDNAFYIAVDELGQEQVFSWTKQTALYSGINEMTQGLGIDPTNNVLAILLTYWMLLTIVYVIVDIVIVLFVKLTHFITA